MKKRAEQHADNARRHGRLRKTLCLAGAIALIVGGAAALLRRFGGGNAAQ